MWDWSDESNEPIHMSDIPAPDLQVWVRFSPVDAHDIVTNGSDRVVFWRWEDGEKFRYFAPPISTKDLRQPVGSFTCTSFLHDGSRAVSATRDGDLILWDVMPGVAAGPAMHTDKAAAKIVRVCPDTAIGVTSTTDRYIVAGSDDGAVRFYDTGLRLIAWFEDMEGGEVRSVSFAAVGGSVGQQQQSVDEGEDGTRWHSHTTCICPS